MNRVCSIFAQVLQFIPRLEFAAAVRKHQAERHARGFHCWTQLVAMLFCQLGRAQSLREIVGGLADRERGILRDEVVLLTKIQEAGPEARMRRIEVWIEEKQESMVFFTNHLKLNQPAHPLVSRLQTHHRLA